MSPSEVLALPARLFFAMDSQIARVRAEVDLRSLAISTSSMGGEGAKEVHKALVAEQGEVFVLERSRVVYAEAGAISKLKAIMA